MNNLQVETIKLEPAKIEFNHEQIEQELEENLKKYEGLTFTEESTKELRATLAELRKGKNAVDDYRKEIKKELTQPVKKFEDKCKDLNKRFDDVINPLKRQLDDFETKRKEEKAAEIKELITKIIEEFELIEPFSNDLIVEDDMLAKSRSMKSIEDTLTFKATHLKTQQDKLETDKKLVESSLKALNAEHGTDFNAGAYTSLLEFEDIDSVLEKMESHVMTEVKKRKEAKEKRLEELKRHEELEEKQESADQPEQGQMFMPPIEETESEFMPDPFVGTVENDYKVINYSIAASKYEHDHILDFLNQLGVTVTIND